MMRIASGLCAATVAFAVTVSAQEPTTKPQTTPQPAAKSEKTMTISGCIQKGADASSFVLSNVTAVPPAGATGATGTTGGAGAPSGPKPESKYSLVADPSVDLSKHVGHKVEITGSPAAEAKSAPRGEPGAPPAAAGASGEAKFQVSSLKMVSATCP
jgi:hypothetical protein